MLNNSIKFIIEHKLVAALLLAAMIGFGLSTAPFDWNLGDFPKNPVAVDAIPDIGENQQIVFTKWEGRSPKDIEDQITYPLTTALMGISGVKTVRSSSMFGFSSIYIIFNDEVDFYWSRSRILEKLNALPSSLLPENVQPTLGPDATGLGQIFWYTLEGRDENGNVTGGWDLRELRSIQDYYVKPGLSSAADVSEVASIGGFVQEYQIDVQPDVLKKYNLTLAQVVNAVRNTNKEIGAKTLEINRAEYVVRGLGYIKSIADIENTPIKSESFTPVLIKDVASVYLGPAERRGILDKEGAEVVGGVVVARYGANPMQVINNVKEKINTIASGLPTKVLKDGRTSQLTIVPFYDRTELIQETLHTLEEALSLEILITLLIIIIMVYNLRASFLIASILPVAVLVVFVAMKLGNVDANIVALSGIAIAIGTMVDMGIVLVENITRHIEEDTENTAINTIVYNATAEVSGAIVTAVFTTIVSFIPVFMLVGAEGKLFSPLAFTKTMALVAAIIITLFVLPAIAAWLFGWKSMRKRSSLFLNIILIAISSYAIFNGMYLGIALFVFGVVNVLEIQKIITPKTKKQLHIVTAIVTLLILLSYYWRPLGYTNHISLNFVFVTLICGLVIGSFLVFIHYYERLLRWALANKLVFLSIPLLILIAGISIWRNTGKEFMPALNEGSFLLMPTSLPHAGIEQNKQILQKLDMAVANIPEIETVVGKAGRVESALDPAPLSMYENIIIYKPEYILDKNGKPQRFKVNDKGEFILKDISTALDVTNDTNVSSSLDENNKDISTALDVTNKNQTSVQKAQETSNENNTSVRVARGTSVVSKTASKRITAKDLIPDENGAFYRNWRPHINSPDDIWNEIVQNTKIPSVTSAPKLQPIETRLIMLQTGMRSPMGIKIKGADLAEIEAFGLELEKILKQVPEVKQETVFAERLIGKPYLILDINREEIARYGLSIQAVQDILEVAIGGKMVTQTVEGRERYNVRVRYPRELRANPSDLENIYIPLPNGSEILLKDVVTIRYEKGPQMIKSEDTFLVSYVLFNKQSDIAEVTLVEQLQQQLKERIADGRLQVPKGVSYEFSGTYEQQVRAEKTLSIIIPIVLLVIFLILYFQFSSIATSLFIFGGIAVAFAGGFIMIWLYGQSWFLNFDIFGTNLRQLFQIETINLSVAVWVGFIALFGIATDDGVIMATYLKQSFAKRKVTDTASIRNAVVAAGKKRIRPCLMTTATTLLALLPILTSTRRGSDIMIPMAIPSFGGMLIALITLFIVPVLYSWHQEIQLKRNTDEA
ncbi:Cu(I)/Ag(I) efflux system membrane protein CusA/SilA [Kordia periserrulae]|uniref:Cu(I)/Ag(I) efflux system membrane protein CusA/SilA n=1 Tax=Kordia periserrulae TaxID=701523 RepID=A0A2T6C1V2_9FLAO|nr:efflux RND transporter permease subunit [Kordia periserrulae]PTX62300.1 Cu(I)/Ag(I) efflux system membrane protein CusA/SilA [Kordia periserrulae]